MPYNYLKAKQSGANDDQIQKELYDHGVKYNVSKAKAAGATDDQINQELSKSTQDVSGPQQVEQKTSLLDKFKGAANTAVSAVPTIMGTVAGAAGSIFGDKGRSISTGAGTAAGQVFKQSAQHLLGTEDEQTKKSRLAKEIGLDVGMGRLTKDQARQKLADIGITSPEQLQQAKGTADYQAVKPLVEGGIAAGVDYSMGKALDAAGKVANKLVVNPAKGLIKEFIPKNAPSELFESVFTIPRKIQERLNMGKMSTAMTDYGIHGNLDDLAEVAGKVTGKDGAMSRAVRESLDKIQTPIDLNVALDAASNASSNALNLDDNIAKKTVKKVAGIINSRQSDQIGKAGALDIWDSVTALEKEGYGLINKSTDLSPNPSYEQQGQIFLDAAEALKSQIDNAQISPDVFGKIKTKYASELSPISKELSQKVMGANNISDLRAIASDFVNLNQAVDITKNNSSTAFQKLLGNQSGVGGIKLNQPGTYLKFVTDRPGIRTATAVNMAKNKNVPSIIGNAANSAAKSRSLLSPFASSITGQVTGENIR